MKFYRKDHYQIFQRQLGMDIKLKQSLEKYVLNFSKLVFKFVRKTGLEESKIGALNMQDITQAGFAGLIEGWNNVDWKTIEGKPNGIKALVNYLSSYVDRQIKREIYRDATGVAIPEYLIAQTKREQLVDKLFGNWLYSFKTDDFYPGTFLRYADMIDGYTSNYEIDVLNDKLTGEMFRILSDKERQIIRWNFGLDDDKLTIPQICERLGMSQRGVEDAKFRALKKMSSLIDENLFENFL